MTEENKKIDVTPESQKGFLRESFGEALAQTGEALDVVSRNLRSTLKEGEKLTARAYDFVEATVGKDRIIGGVLGAKAGGTVGMIGGIPGMIKGGAAGAIVGFIGGRKFIEWYNKDENSGNPPENEGNTPPPP